MKNEWDCSESNPLSDLRKSMDAVRQAVGNSPTYLMSEAMFNYLVKTQAIKESDTFFLDSIEIVPEVEP